MHNKKKRKKNKTKDNDKPKDNDNNNDIIEPNPSDSEDSSGTEIGDTWKPGVVKKRKSPLLSSVQQLIKECEKNAHEGLSQIFKDFTFIGCVDSRYAIIQHLTKMYLCDVCLLSKELIYQECLQCFGEFEKIKLKEPFNIRELLLLVLELPTSDWTPEDGPKENIAEYIKNLLVEKKEKC